MATQSFPAPTHFIFQSVGDFEHTKHKMVPQARANIFICLLDHTYEAPLANGLMWVLSIFDVIIAQNSLHRLRCTLDVR